jgi:hypothetical protein
MSKIIYDKDTTGLNTVTLPYMPKMGLDDMYLPQLPDYFTERFEVPGFELHEVQGSRLVLMEDGWSELGFVAIWKRVGEGGTQE